MSSVFRYIFTSKCLRAGITSYHININQLDMKNKLIGHETLLCKYVTRGSDPYNVI